MTPRGAGADEPGGHPAPGIHLMVPMLHRRDAVGEHTRTLRDLLLAAGVPSSVYTELPDPDTVDETRPYRDYERDAVPGDVLVYQVATRSDMTRWLARRPEPVVLNYHSITPAPFFARWNNGIARMQEAAVRDLAELAPRCALGIGVSEFDVAELHAAGCPATRVVPVANVPLPPAAPDPAAAAVLARRAAGGGPWWLSVGRLAPNKAHQDTIAALFVARATTAPDAHLTIVGGPTEPHYAAALRRYAADLGLSGAVEFTTQLTPGELAARYGAADVLVMLSEHEGFGVPLVEAMSQGLPVVAYDAGAVAEVMGGAGVLLDRKGPRAVADAVAALLGDPARRDALGGRRPGPARRARARARRVRPGQGVAGGRLRCAGGCRPVRTGCPRASRLTHHPLGSSLMDSPHYPSPVTLSAVSPGAVEMKSGADVGPSSDIFQRLLKERIVFIGSAIDQNTANLVCSQLILLEAENQERDISVYINSPGGSVTDGLAIYDTMQYVRCDVRTICVGLAASMGQFLLCAGTPGKRFALPHSRILMHQPSGGMQGQASDIAIQAEQIIYLKRMLAERIAFHTGQPVERIEADSDRDRWFTAEEAREYGFIDEVIQKDTMPAPTAGSGSAT